MTDGSLYLSTIITTNKTLAKGASSLEHSLRIEEDYKSNTNYKRDMESENRIYFPNENDSEDIQLQKYSDFTKEELIAFKEKVMKRHNDTKPKKVSPSDIKNRSKSLKVLRDKVQDPVFQKLLEDYNNDGFNLENKQELIKQFKKQEKVSKPLEKNLMKYLNLVEKIGVAAKTKKESSLKNTSRVEMVEMVVRIPLKNNVSHITSEEMLLYNQDFFKRNFPDYEVIVAVAHNDELHKEKFDKNKDKDYQRKLIGQHSHIFIDAKNQRTGEFDYYKQQHNLVKQHLRNNGVSEEDIRGQLGEYGNQKLFQVKNQGKFLMNFMYEDINKNLLNDRGYNAVQGFTAKELDLTQEEIQERKAKIEAEKSNKISDRKYNGIAFEEKQIKEEREVLEQLQETLVEDIKTEHSEKLSEIEQFKEVKEELSNEVVELENQVDYLSQEQIRENELKSKNDLKVEELEEMTLKIIQKKEEESKIETSIQKLKGDRKKVSKDDMEDEVDLFADKIIGNNNNFNTKVGIKIGINENYMKSNIVKETRKLLKVDMYDNDIQVITKRIQSKADEKILEVKTQMGDLQKKYDTLNEDHTILKSNLENEVAKQVLKVEDTYKSTISTLEYNHKNSITALETEHKEKVSNLQTEHNKETFELNNIIDNRDSTISTLEKDKSKLQIQVKKLQDKYQSFKSKIKSMFVKSSNLNNGLKNAVAKLQDTTNNFRDKVSDLEYDIKLVNEHDNTLIDTLNKEDDKKIEELFNNRIEEPTEDKKPRLVIKPIDAKALEINFDKDEENQSHSTRHRQ